MACLFALTSVVADAQPLCPSEPEDTAVVRMRGSLDDVGSRVVWGAHRRGLEALFPPRYQHLIFDIVWKISGNGPEVEVTGLGSYWEDVLSDGSVLKRGWFWLRFDDGPVVPYFGYTTGVAVDEPITELRIAPLVSVPDAPVMTISESGALSEFRTITVGPASGFAQSDQCRGTDAEGSLSGSLKLIELQTGTGETEFAIVDAALILSGGGSVARFDGGGRITNDPASEAQVFSLDLASNCALLNPQQLISFKGVGTLDASTGAMSFTVTGPNRSCTVYELTVEGEPNVP